MSLSMHAAAVRHSDGLVRPVRYAPKRTAGEVKEVAIPRRLCFRRSAEAPGDKEDQPTSICVGEGDAGCPLLNLVMILTD